MSEAPQANDILQVVPGDAADRVLTDHSGDDDPQARHDRETLADRGRWLSVRQGAGQRAFRRALIRQRIAVVKHDREQRAHTLDAVNRLAGQ
jgi:hypothetical protein